MAFQPSLSELTLWAQENYEQVKGYSGGQKFAVRYGGEVHNQALGFQDDVGASTNLLTGPWVNWAHWIRGVGAEACGPGFDAVTNNLTLDNALPSRLILLEID